MWAQLTAALAAHDWHAARAAKHAVEEAQRVRDRVASSAHDCLRAADALPVQAARKAREAAGVQWAPRFFEADGAGGWALKADVAVALTAAACAAPPAQAPVTPLVPPSRQDSAA